MCDIKLVPRIYNILEFEMSEEDELLEILRNDPKIVVLDDYKNTIEDERIFLEKNI